MAIMLSACAPEPPLVNRYLNSTWQVPDTGEKLDLTDLQWKSDGYAYFHTAGRRCVVIMYAKGDMRDGYIHLWAPVQMGIEPQNADTAPCEFMRSVTYYAINGDTLTISFDNGTKTKQFRWFSDEGIQ